MAIRDLAELSQMMLGSLDDPELQNIHAQAQARALLDQLDTPTDDWPHFRGDIDERLVYISNIMISNGIDLKESPEHYELANQLLSRGAEALEFLCSVEQIRVSVPDEILKAAVAYHIAGYHARSYVLMQKLDNMRVDGDPLSYLLKSLIKRNLADARGETFRFFDLSEYEDSSIAEELNNGTMQYDDAIANIGRKSFAEAVSQYLEYLKTGNENLIEDAIIKCREVAELGRDSYHVDLWFWGRALERMMQDLGHSSLWTGLKHLSTNPAGRSLLEKYIESHNTRTPAVISLWPSQRKALDLLKHPDAPSFCIKMPTSAGKTKIAEMAIVRALLDNYDEDETKCIYIAPYRSLAVEVEATLRKALKPIGVRVSEIYGGFDVSATEEMLIQDTQILIATPEKFDAVIRLAPDLLEGVRLVIFDEGHQTGSLDERGLRAEFLLNRLLCRLGRDNCRYVFISAVLPNPDDFAMWISGDNDNVAISDWRPSRLVLGLCLWNRQRVRLEYSHQSAEPLEQDVFVSRFLNITAVRGLEGVGRRRNPFPHDQREAFAATAIRFTQYGSTLAFVPQAVQVVPMAKRILVSIKMMRAIAISQGRELDYPTPDEDTPLMQECLSAIIDELGENAEILQFLRAGIAIHHGNLPARVRQLMERLVRSGEVKLIVATTTLAQGVNLPIRTVIVRGVQQGQSRLLNPLDFWNIVGRAGRAMHENDGQILFFIDETKEDWQIRRQKDIAERLIEQTGIQAVIGVLHRALSFMREIWKTNSPDLDFNALCLKLSEDDFDWTNDQSRSLMRQIFRVIDQHLLAIAIENGFSPDQPDILQEVLRQSLLFTQLISRPIEDIDPDSAHSILLTRLLRIYRTIPDNNRRKRFYSLAMPLSDCVIVENSEERLIELIGRCGNWDDLNPNDQMDILLSLSELALQLDAVTSMENKVPVVLPEIVKSWLSGLRCIEMVENGLAIDFSDDPGRLSKYLERICVYGISWAVNGFVSYVRQRLEENNQQVPAVAEFLPSMFKIGVNNALATIIAPYLQLNRQLSLIVANVCPFTIDEPNRVVAWLNNVTAAELLRAGIDQENVTRIINLQRVMIADYFFDVAEDLDVRAINTDAEQAEPLRQGDTVIFRARPDRGNRSYEVYTVKGIRIGRFSSTNPLPEWLKDTHLIHTVISGMEERPENRIRVELNSRRLAI